MEILIGVAICMATAFVLIINFSSRRSLPFIRSLKQKHLVITGGSTGIGFAIAKQALAQGAFVTLISRSSTNLTEAVEKLVKELHCTRERIRFQVADVSDYKAISTAIKESCLWKPIDVLVCNAGLTRGGYLDQTAVEELDLTVRTNLLGTIYPLHAALPAMKQRSIEFPSSIVITSSLASLYMLYGHTVYTATKYAVRGLAEGLRLELLPFNIKVSLVCPGFVNTPFLDEADKQHSICQLMKVIHMYDRKHAEQPESVACYTLDAVKEGRFLVTTQQPVGFCMAALGRGFAPAESFGKSILEAFSCFFIRLVSMKHAEEVHRRILMQTGKDATVKYS